MSQPRFYVDTEPAADSRLALPHDEAGHALRVLRLRPGAGIVLLNGRGVLAVDTTVRSTGTAHSMISWPPSIRQRA